MRRRPHPSRCRADGAPSTSGRTRWRPPGTPRCRPHRRAGAVPCGLAARERDVVQRAATHAGAARRACIRRDELRIVHEHGVEQRVLGAAAETTLRRDRLFGKRLAAANEISHLVDARLGALDQSAALRFVRRVVQRQVVLGHENRCEAAKAQPDARAQLLRIGGRVADASPAGQDEVGVVAAREGRTADPPIHHPGQAPRIGGRHEHERLP